MGNGQHLKKALDKKIEVANCELKRWECEWRWRGGKIGASPGGYEGDRGGGW